MARGHLEPRATAFSQEEEEDDSSMDDILDEVLATDRVQDDPAVPHVIRSETTESSGAKAVVKSAEYGTLSRKQMDAEEGKRELVEQSQDKEEQRYSRWKRRKGKKTRQRSRGDNRGATTPVSLSPERHFETIEPIPSDPTATTENNDIVATSVPSSPIPYLGDVDDSGGGGSPEDIITDEEEEMVLTLDLSFSTNMDSFMTSRQRGTGATETDDDELGMGGVDDDLYDAQVRNWKG